MTEVIARPDLIVRTASEVPTVAAIDGDAVAIGLLFDRPGGTRLRQLSSPPVPAGQFTSQFWGAYVLISAADGVHSVLRDPSGSIPVYHCRIHGIDIYASDLGMLAVAGAPPPEPDIDYLRGWLGNPRLRAKHTGIAGIEEILPGEVHLAGPRGARRALAWSPRAHVSPDRTLDDFETAAAALRDALLFTIPRLAAGSGDVMLQLSGGLDSSIIAGALAAAGTRFSAMTFSTRAPDGDERVYAREVAEYCKIELAELAETPAALDFTPNIHLALRPPPTAPLRPLHRAFARHLRQTGAQLALDGSGGDNVFAFPGSAAPALDALRAGGPAAALRAIDDLARIYHVTAWAVAKAAWRRSRRARTVWEQDTSFLSPGVVVDRPTHPWLDDLPQTPRGKFEHVQSIVGIAHFLSDPVPDGPAALHPLLAQPVLETCLRIPSWTWVRGGRDRSVVRAAFKDLLPDTILTRRSKGRLESMFVSGYMAARSELEGLLADGRLARSGFLDIASIRAYLQRPEQPRDAGYIRLLEIASAELWLRSFET